ncbi:hypothetical protein HU200_002414 [Digitaria exilis]|uniref:Uncharacterized protein n=1 Tax=Digitaria exilis TaxID=1010633 RepID=A0A835FVT6_9POAL|nr:hypothetical protein HU200_002414 [Digitaria exilis]
MSRGTLDLSRNPCPDRIVEDIGGGFGMGALGGGAFHFAKGLYNSPSGYRLAGGATAMRMTAPGVAGGFAVWSGLYSTFDCAFVYARNKEDPWNSIAAGASTGGLLALRRGLRASAASAAVGAGLLALIEGAGILINRLDSLRPPPQPGYLPPVMETPADGDGLPPIVDQELPGPTGFFGGIFGRKKHDHKVAIKSEVLELDLPSTAVPSFD